MNGNLKFHPQLPVAIRAILATASLAVGVCAAQPASETPATAPSLEETLAAALEGDARAQSLIASMYEERESHEDAVRWYRKAAEQGRADAQFKLGFYHATGNGGLQRDFTTAVEWFRKAAEQNQPGAQYNLAVCYEKGLGVTQDDATALGWHRRAAAQGDVHAQKAVGVCYEKGRGVKPDPVEARAWYLLASAHGNTEATALLKNMAAGLKPGQIEQAEKRAGNLSLQIYKSPLGATAEVKSKKGPTKDFLE